MSLKFLKVLTLLVALTVLGDQARAATQEAPPAEPPYTDDNEFDGVLEEDPLATNEPIPVEQPQEKAPVATTTPARPRTTTTAAAVKSAPQKGVKMIHHPDAKKGLIRIEADGSYIYKVKTTPKTRTGVVRFGFMDPPAIESADGSSNFKTMYGSGTISTLMFDYEWQPFSKYGKFGTQVGAGVATAAGQGRFLNGSGEAPEKYTFLIVPLNAGIIYRLEYFRRQWIAPYLSAGGSYIAVAEMRDDGKNNFSGTPAGYGAGGLMFNITALDKKMAFNLDAEYGVGNLWFVAEYRYQKALSEDLDFTGGLLSFGISADF